MENSETSSSSKEVASSAVKDDEINTVKFNNSMENPGKCSPSKEVSAVGDIDETNTEQNTCGGYSYELVNENVKEMKELECPICCLLMRDAQELSCHHAMCLSCLEKWEKENIEKESSFTCPQCCIEISKEKTGRSGIIDRLITTSIKVKCDNSDRGCDWIGVISDVVIHMDEKCDFTKVECSNERCGYIVERRMMEAHNEECLYRTIRCSYCGFHIAYIDQEDHFKECENATVKCRNKNCLKCLPRKEISLHEVDECDFKLIKCQFKCIGCEVECSLKDMEEHLTLSANTHMSMMLADLTTTKTELSTTKEELSKTKDELRVTKAELDSTKATLTVTRDEMEVDKGKLGDACEKIDQVKVENEKQGKAMNELIRNNLHTLIEKCQYFQDMEKSVVNMKKELKSVTDAITSRISSFDAELKLLINENNIQELNNLNNLSVSLHNFKIAEMRNSCIGLDRSVLVHQVGMEFQKCGQFLTEDDTTLVIKEALKHYDVLVERSSKYLIADWKETTYKERFSALMDVCPGNGMILHGDSVALKLDFLSDFNGQWKLKIRKTPYFNTNACKINTDTKEVEIDLPRFYYSAGFYHYNTFFYEHLTLYSKTENEQIFLFPNLVDIWKYALNGFLLINLFDTPS